MGPSPTKVEAGKYDKYKESFFPGMSMRLSTDKVDSSFLKDNILKNSMIVVQHCYCL